MTPLPMRLEGGEDFPPLSALNDLLFCARRCYLHRVEGVWRDNVHTVQGTLDHRRAHETRETSPGTMRVARGLSVISHRLRVAGVADVVEFRPEPFPVEYKRGRRRRWSNDDVQLCAQAMALEEMLGVSIPAGAIYHVTTRRRREVMFDAALRRLTQEAATTLHEILQRRTAPAPLLKPRCQGCSLRKDCMPELISAPQAYVRAASGLYQINEGR